jgi:hypothetical protein
MIKRDMKKILKKKKKKKTQLGVKGKVKKRSVKLAKEIAGAVWWRFHQVTITATRRHA